MSKKTLFMMLLSGGILASFGAQADECEFVKQAGGICIFKLVTEKSKQQVPFRMKESKKGCKKIDNLLILPPWKKENFKDCKFPEKY